MNSLTIDLPLPPSTNSLFINLKGGGRAKSASYKAWSEEARYHIILAWRAAGKPQWHHQEPMQLDIRLGLEGRRRDASNCIKAIEDVLVAELPIPDDCYNDRILIERDTNIPGFARVTIAPLHPG